MVIKILSSAATFNAVKYNFEKLASGKAELLRVKNFGPLEGMDAVRQEDYKNYLKMVSARNTRTKQSQFHAVISAKGKSHAKEELAVIAEKWLNEMGYAKQPYLIFFHKDTDDNHIHIVSTRIDKEGKKISSEFEHVRAVSVMNQIIGLDENAQALKDIEIASAYRFSTLAQFKLLLEEKGYSFQDNHIVKFGKKLAKVDFEKLVFAEPNQARVKQLKAIFSKYTPNLDADKFAKYMEEKHGIKLVFHAKDNKPAYGYTIIDHAQKNVFKGSAIMPLKELQGQHTPITITKSIQQHRATASQHSESAENLPPVRINLTADIDDEKVYGRRRKKKNSKNHDHHYR